MPKVKKRAGSRPPTKWKRQMLDAAFKMALALPYPMWLCRLLGVLGDRLGEALDPMPRRMKGVSKNV